MSDTSSELADISSLADGLGVPSDSGQTTGPLERPLTYVSSQDKVRCLHYSFLAQVATHLRTLRSLLLLRCEG